MLVKLQKIWIVLILVISLYNIIVIRVIPSLNIFKKRSIYRILHDNDITKLGIKFDHIKQFIPKGEASIGYIAEKPDKPVDEYTRTWYIIQYNFAPISLNYLTIDNKFNNDFILAYFYMSRHHEPMINSLRQRNYNIIYGDQDGFFLFKRSKTQ
jgi:hypothetical protein